MAPSVVEIVQSSNSGRSSNVEDQWTEGESELPTRVFRTNSDVEMMMTSPREEIPDPSRKMTHVNEILKLFQQQSKTMQN
eukprot:TRINITY_DN2643_c0_g1_i1.p1 TRINITY_DN2643_c0_g1~~TRINITY_DN2643_c0_g1_i1.p1  ORF type:complete len:88 (+),score=16.18 TRINITY_DN2643_c0_g1_i1:27-266(+)